MQKSKNLKFKKKKKLLQKADKICQKRTEKKSPVPLIINSINKKQKSVKTQKKKNENHTHTTGKQNFNLKNGSPNFQQNNKKRKNQRKIIKGKSSRVIIKCFKKKKNHYFSEIISFDACTKKTPFFHQANKCM